ncbi:hypothetical protein [Paludibacterium purpuratum]|uniref:SH3 domain-containing protein n=1 Tax=Paludibacterium purpuratum TaxID=1144873 RepID=A0A4R7B652_9NEIS|nr:hypothetical protein [Paludibacterium purpuratum]TDR78383.1 hypothetical protein DFP86_108100 [Paludibacterium purpuratum]
MKRQFPGRIPAVLCTTLLMMSQAWGGSTIWTPPSACTTLNCDATIVHANITSSSTNPGGSVEPFVLQVHSSPQYCMRLDVFNQSAWMHIAVVAPDGTVWRNFGRAPNDYRPLVVVPSGVQGWYTVQISLVGGRTATPGVHYNADLAYGRYTSVANPNCANPTPPSLKAKDADQIAGPSNQTSK